MACGSQNLLEPTEPVYSCAACFGHDLCAECQRDGAAEAHTSRHGPAHVFTRER